MTPWPSQVAPLPPPRENQDSVLLLLCFLPVLAKVLAVFLTLQVRVSLGHEGTEQYPPPGSDVPRWGQVFISGLGTQPRSHRWHDTADPRSHVVAW